MGKLFNMKYFPGIYAAFVAIFIGVALFVPDDSIFKEIFGYFTGLVVITLAFWFSPASNPLRRFLRRKRTGK
jgi:hypothetical protein